MTKIERVFPDGTTKTLTGLELANELVGGAFIRLVPRGAGRVNFDNAACQKSEAKGVNFFPDPHQLLFVPALAEPAKRVCATCPMRQECLAEHLDEPDGIFGGLDVRERRRLNNHNERSYRVLTGRR